MSRPERAVPGLFVGGQPKSGSTALYTFLNEHPEVFMTVPKEPHFFCSDFIRESDSFHDRRISRSIYQFRSTEEYMRLYPQKRQSRVFGEASTNYLYSKEAARAIYKVNPNAKFVFGLRAPISFLVSLHAQYLNETLEDIEDFNRAMEAESKRKSGSRVPKRIPCPSYLFYSDRIKYSEQLKRYFRVFPERNIKVVIFEEFKENNEDTFRDILHFLNVDSNFTPAFKKVHGSKTAKSRTLNRFMRNPALKAIPKRILPVSVYDPLQKKIQSLLLKEKKRKPLKQEITARYMKKFKPEVEKVSELLDRDLVTLWGYDSIP